MRYEIWREKHASTGGNSYIYNPSIALNFRNVQNAVRKVFAKYTRSSNPEQKLKNKKNIHVHHVHTRNCLLLKSIDIFYRTLYVDTGIITQLS